MYSNESDTELNDSQGVTTSNVPVENKATDHSVFDIERAFPANITAMKTVVMDSVSKLGAKVDTNKDKKSTETRNTGHRDEFLIKEINTKGNLAENKNIWKNESLPLVMPTDLMSHMLLQSTPTTSSNLYALCELWDFAGQKEFYATHQAFLTSNAVYLVVADMDDDISKEDINLYFADFKDVGGMC